MMNELTINTKNRTIEMTKKFANASKRYGSREYEDLQAARRDYPTYKVVTRSTKRKKDSFKGLDLAYMENYIKTHEKENTAILIDFYKLCGKDENGKAIKIDNKVIEHASYGEIKKWFLKQYPIFKEYTENVDKILNKKIA